MVDKKTWQEFKDSGLLWWINMILHTFGWAIVVKLNNDGEITEAYPARTAFRGFSNKENSRGYIKVSEYMKDNSEKLLEEANNE